MTIFNQVKWRLTATYLLVTLAAILMLAWWGLVAGTVYLQRANPSQSWMEVIQGQILPALETILPSVLVIALPASLVSAYFGFLTARWLDLRLGGLRKATQAWQQGNFSVFVTDDASDEISSFGQELNHMARKLEHLLKIREDLAALEERNHLASDLHDSVKQQVTAALFQIEAAEAMFDHSPNAAKASLAEAGNLVHTAHQELNSIIFDLRPAALRSGNLSEALRKYVDEWARQNSVAVELELQAEGDLRSAIQQEVYRFVQEALSNIARHSQATKVSVGLRLDKRAMVLTIQDNGCGFEIKPVLEAGYGLKTMRERIERAGGELSLASQPQQGTRITAIIPLSEPG